MLDTIAKHLAILCHSVQLQTQHENCKIYECSELVNRVLLSLLIFKSIYGYSKGNICALISCSVTESNGFSSIDNLETNIVYSGISLVSISGATDSSNICMTFCHQILSSIYLLWHKFFPLWFSSIASVFVCDGYIHFGIESKHCKHWSERRTRISKHVLSE